MNGAESCTGVEEHIEEYHLTEPAAYPPAHSSHLSHIKTEDSELGSVFVAEIGEKEIEFFASYWLC